MISAARARELFSYDPSTGVLTRKTGPRAGVIANRPRPDGYVMVTADRHLLYAHRIAWMVATGQTPEVIDHIDGDRINNRLNNLRNCSTPENNRNAGMRKDNRSGVTGVHRHGDGKKWAAQIKTTPGKTKHLGLFSTVAEAAVAVAAARERYGYHKNHGRSVAHDGPVASEASA